MTDKIELTAENVENVVQDNAKTFAKGVINFEKRSAQHVKAWGHAFLNAVKLYGMDSDTMIGATKRGIGWDALAGKAGKAVKGRMSKNFSQMRAILEDWADIPSDIRDDLLNGVRSFGAVAEKRAADKRKAAKAAEKAAKAEENADDNADGNADDEPTVTDKGDNMAIIQAATALIAGMTPEELADNEAAIAQLQSAITAASERLIDTVISEAA